MVTPNLFNCVFCVSFWVSFLIILPKTTERAKTDIQNSFAMPNTKTQYSIQLCLKGNRDVREQYNILYDYKSNDKIGRFKFCITGLSSYKDNPFNMGNTSFYSSLFIHCTYWTYSSNSKLRINPSNKPNNLISRDVPIQYGMIYCDSKITI